MGYAAFIVYPAAFIVIAIVLIVLATVVTAVVPRRFWPVLIFVGCPALAFWPLALMLFSGQH